MPDTRPSDDLCEKGDTPCHGADTAQRSPWAQAEVRAGASLPTDSEHRPRMGTAGDAAGATQAGAIVADPGDDRSGSQPSATQ